MTLLRMDNVLVVVDDLEAAIEFFVELGLELEGRTMVEGPYVDRIVGLDGVRSEIAMMRTPDGHGPARAGQVPRAAFGQTRATRRTGEHARDPKDHVHGR